MSVGEVNALRERALEVQAATSDFARPDHKDVAVGSKMVVRAWTSSEGVVQMYNIFAVVCGKTISGVDLQVKRRFEVEIASDKFGNRTRLVRPNWDLAVEGDDKLTFYVGAGGPYKDKLMGQPPMIYTLQWYDETAEYRNHI